MGLAYRQDIRVKRIEVNQQVNTGISKCGHATIVVGTCVNMIDPQSVGAKLLHKLDIALALLGVDQRVIRAKLVCNTCKKTFVSEVVHVAS